MRDKRSSADDAALLASEVIGEVAEKAQHAEQLHKQQRYGHRRVKLLGATASILFVVLAITSFNTSVEPPTPEEIRRDIRADMSMLVYDLADFHQTNREYPKDLASIGLDQAYASEWDYQRLAKNRYRLAYTEEGQTVSYESSESADVFFAEVRDLD